MKLSTLILFIGGTTAGIYLQSKEGEKSRKKLKDSLDNVKPVLKDLAKKLDQMVSDSQGIKSDEIRANLEKKVDQIKKSISKIDSEKIAEVTDDAIKAVARKVRELRAEVLTEPTTSLKPIVKQKKEVKAPTKKTTKKK